MRGADYMKRRDFARFSLLAPASLTASAAGTPQIAGTAQSAIANRRLFPTDLPGPEWKQFPAAGFRGPACGVIYRRKRRPQNGMPLGAIDTGRLDLQTDANFGFCTIYNSICPQRGPLNLPFL